MACGPAGSPPAWLCGDTGLIRATSAGQDGAASSWASLEKLARRGPGLPRRAGAALRLGWDSARSPCPAADLSDVPMRTLVPSPASGTLTPTAAQLWLSPCPVDERRGVRELVLFLALLPAGLATHGTLGRCGPEEKLAGEGPWALSWLMQLSDALIVGAGGPAAPQAPRRAAPPWRPQRSGCSQAA